MKNSRLLLVAGSVALATMSLVSCGPTNVIVHEDSYTPAPAPTVEEVSYQSFYDQLSPYGNWINYPGYGYVWMPNAGPDFRPYSTNGNWVYTDAGWAWNSGYNWGWAPFHYGRWFMDNNYGWLWVPGNEWAPAWVSWRGNTDYYGWAPLGPHVSVEMAMGSYNPPAQYWNFVPTRYMGTSGWHNYYVNDSRNVTIVNNTTIINNYNRPSGGHYSYAPGPDPNDVRRFSGNNFQTAQVRSANTPGERYTNNQFTVYRPSVNANQPANNGGARPAAPAPSRYQAYNGQPANPNRQPVNQPPVNNQPNYNRQNEPVYQPNYNRNEPVNQPSYRPVEPTPSGRPNANPPQQQTQPRPAANYQPQPTNPANHPGNNPPSQQTQPRPIVNSQPAQQQTQPRPNPNNQGQQRQANPQPQPVQQHPVNNNPQQQGQQRPEQHPVNTRQEEEARPSQKPIPAQPQNQNEHQQTRQPE